MSVQSPDPNRVVELIAAAAAEIILPRFRALGDGEIDGGTGIETIMVNMPLRQ